MHQPLIMLTKQKLNHANQSMQKQNKQNKSKRLIIEYVEKQ